MDCDAIDTRWGRDVAPRSPRRRYDDAAEVIKRVDKAPTSPRRQRNGENERSRIAADHGIRLRASAPFVPFLEDENGELSSSQKPLSRNRGETHRMIVNTTIGNSSPVRNKKLFLAPVVYSPRRKEKLDHGSLEDCSIVATCSLSPVHCKPKKVKKFIATTSGYTSPVKAPLASSPRRNSVGGPSEERSVLEKQSLSPVKSKQKKKMICRTLVANSSPLRTRRLVLAPVESPSPRRNSVGSPIEDPSVLEKRSLSPVKSRPKGKKMGDGPPFGSASPLRPRRLVLAPVTSSSPRRNSVGSPIEDRSSPVRNRRLALAPVAPSSPRRNSVGSPIEDRPVLEKRSLSSVKSRPQGKNRCDSSPFGTTSPLRPRRSVLAPATLSSPRRNSVGGSYEDRSVLEKYSLSPVKFEPKMKVDSTSVRNSSPSRTRRLVLAPVVTSPRRNAVNGSRSDRSIPEKHSFLPVKSKLTVKVKMIEKTSIGNTSPLKPRRLIFAPVSASPRRNSVSAPDRSVRETYSLAPVKPRQRRMSFQQRSSPECNGSHGSNHGVSMKTTNSKGTEVPSPAERQQQHERTSPQNSFPRFTDLSEHKTQSQLADATATKVKCSWPLEEHLHAPSKSKASHCHWSLQNAGFELRDREEGS